MMAKFSRLPSAARVAGTANLTVCKISPGEMIEGQPVPGNGIAAHIQLFAQDVHRLLVLGE